MNSRSSKSDPSGALPSRITVGRIRKPHGVRGGLVVDVTSDVEDRFVAGSELDLVAGSGDRVRARILTVTVNGRIARLRFEGIDTREQADRWRGASLEVAVEEVPPAPPGAYYYFELVDCECSDKRCGELGRVEAVVEDGGGLLLEVSDGRRALLIPFVRSYLLRVDIPRRRIELDLPEGLLDICTSVS